MANILLVDDSRFSRKMLRRFIETRGHTVTECEDGYAALNRYREGGIDIVFLDLTMEVMHGLDVLKSLKEFDEKVVVVVATADVQDTTRELVSQAGASGFLPKPFSLDKVIVALTEVLGEEGLNAAD